MEVKDIMKEAVTIHDDASFYDAIELMVSKQTNTLLVVNKDGVLIGEIYMSDILDAIVPDYLDGDSIAAHFAGSDMFIEAVNTAKDLSVKLFMSTDTAPVELNDGLMAIASAAISKKRVNVPVVDAENKPIGLISRRGIKLIIANTLGIKDTQ